MLRVTPSTHSNAAKKYFGENLSRSDYYIDGQEVRGIWGGKTAAMLGLEGTVDQQRYFALCDNLHPETGGQLTPRMKDNRRIGFDFTFSAPKSVSVAYELSGDERILAAFRASVKETMEDLEGDMKTRSRRGGADDDRVTGNMVWAEFDHFTARPVDGVPDPHLHAHCFVFNATWDEKEKRFKAGQFGDLKRDAFYYEAAFDARLAKRLNALGYRTQKAEYSFELAGTPQSLIDTFSRRRDAIEKTAAEKGILSAEGKHAIGYYGREHKNNDIGKSRLREMWRERLAREDRDGLDAVLRGDALGDQPVTADAAKEYALLHAFERASTVSDKRLQAEALRYAVGSVLPEDVADIAKHKEVVAVMRDGQLMTTTRSVINDEMAMLHYAREGHRAFAPMVDARQLHSSDFAGLSGEQRQAALHVVSSTASVTGVVGKAGTGKTRMMRATVDVIEGSGKHVFTFAPSSQARDVLKKEGFRHAETLAMLLKSEKLQKQVAGQVIWMDEAGLVSSKDMKRLTDIARKGDSRIVLSGDYTQHASVEAGDAFRLMEQDAGVRFARLTEVRRQTEAGYKKAVEAIAEGSGKAAQKGFDALDAKGWIVQASGEERHRMLVADYLKAAEDGKSALIIAPTHAEGGRLTAELRGALKERGAIGTEREFKIRKATGWTEAEKGDARNFEPGMMVEFNQNAKGFKKGEKAVVVKQAGGVFLQKQDGTKAALPMESADRFEVYRSSDIAIGKGDRIRITRNGEARMDGQAKGARLSNGDIYTVEGFDKDGNIRFGNGKLLPNNYGHFAFGYVDTSYASQGKTVDRVFIATGNESLKAANRQQWYVSATRGREMAKVYVDSKDDVRSAIAKSGERLSAVELTGRRIQPGWKSRVRDILQGHHRFRRLVRQRAAAFADYWRQKGREGVSHA